MIYYNRESVHTKTSSPRPYFKAQYPDHEIPLGHNPFGRPGDPEFSEVGYFVLGEWPEELGPQPTPEVVLAWEPPGREVVVRAPNPVKADALKRLRALGGRRKTVGTQLDELTSLVTLLFDNMPD